MKKMMVTKEYWELFPESNIHLLVVTNIDNSIREEDEAFFSQLLNNSKKEAKKYLVEESFSENQVIQEWREAFQKFKTKKGARSSIEALLKRVSQNRDFSPINPLVDIYNGISLKYGVPAGGEDLNQIVGDLYLGKAKGGESFYPLGADTDAPALAEELIYFDEVGAVCRNFNWREAKRTMLQEGTKNAILVIEAISIEQKKRSEAAIKDLKEQIDAYFKTNATIHTLTSEKPSIIIC